MSLRDPLDFHAGLHDLAMRLMADAIERGVARGYRASTIARDVYAALERADFALASRRRTGRTTEQLESALKLALEGKRVLFFAGTTEQARWCERECMHLIAARHPDLVTRFNMAERDVMVTCKRTRASGCVRFLALQRQCGRTLMPSADLARNEDERVQRISRAVDLAVIIDHAALQLSPTFQG